MEAVNNPSAAGVTRVIHNDLQKELDKISGKEQPWQAVFEEHCKSQKLELVGMQRSISKVYAGGHSGLFEAVYNAYYNHLPLCISPDDIWLTILQAVGQHINTNPEELRSKLVNHADKKVLEVELPNFRRTPEEWESAYIGLAKLVQQNVKPEIGATARPEFTTTGPSERAVCSVAIMDAFQAFFEYHIRLGCGLPRVTLAGQLDDWQKLRVAAEQIIALVDMSWWAPYLLPVLDEFVYFYTTGVNLKFWDCIYKAMPAVGSGLYWEDRARQFHAGWITIFYPYIKLKKLVSPMYQKMMPPPTTKNNSLRTLSELYVIHDKFDGKLGKDMDHELLCEYFDSLGDGLSDKSFPAGLSTAPIKVIDMIAGRQYDAQVWAGFFGFTVKTDVPVGDPHHGEVRPAVGWYIGEKHEVTPEVSK